MSSIGAVSGNVPHVQPQPTSQAPKRVDHDHDHDNDANPSRSSEASESGQQGEHKLNVKA